MTGLALSHGWADSGTWSAQLRYNRSGTIGDWEAAGGETIGVTYATNGILKVYQAGINAWSTTNMWWNNTYFINRVLGQDKASPSFSSYNLPRTGGSGNDHYFGWNDVINADLLAGLTYRGTYMHEYYYQYRDDQGTHDTGHYYRTFAVTNGHYIVTNLTGTVDQSAFNGGSALLDGADLKLVKTGGSTLNLTNANTYGGGTYIDEGKVALTTAGTPGSGSIDLGSASVPAGAAELLLDVTEGGKAVTPAIVVKNYDSGGSRTIASVNTTGTNTIAGTITHDNSGDNLRLYQTVGGALWLSNTVSGAGSLWFDDEGGGTLWLTASNAFTGGLYFDAGTLRLAHAQAAGTGTLTLGPASGAYRACYLEVESGSLTIANAVSISEAPGAFGFYIGNQGAGDVQFSGSWSVNRAAFDLFNRGGGTLTLSGAMNLNNGARNLVITGNEEVVISGAISNGSLEKTGSGTLTLNGANTFSGATTVTGGTLSYNGTNASSTVTVKAGATLKGTGTLGPLVVEGTVRPGQTIGTLGVSSLTLAGGGTNVIQYGAAAGVPGTAWDQLLVGAGSGSISVTATPGSPHSILLDASSLTLFTNTMSYAWKIIDGGSVTDFAENRFVLVETGWPDLGTGTLTLRQADGDLYVDFTPAGEATFVWDAGGGSDRDWSQATNWQANIEPTASDTTHINGGYTAVVTQAGEAALDLYVADVNNTTGTVLQTGGVLSLGDDAYIGHHAGSTGAYAITNGTWSIADDLFPGHLGSGTVSIGGTALVTVGDNIEMGNGGAAQGVLTVSGGTLRADDLWIGDEAGSTGSMTLSSGAALITNTVDIGHAGSGALTVSGGTLTLGGALTLGPPSDEADGFGTFRMQGTTGAVSVETDFIIPSSNALFEVTLGAGGVAAVQVGDDIVANGTLTVLTNASFVQNQSVYVLATSLVGKAVSGTFDAIHLPANLAATVRYDNGAVTLNFEPPDDPDPTSATAAGPEDVNLAWTANGDDDDVLILHRAGSAPTGGPTNGATYAVGASLGGGQVIYNGSGSTYFDVQLEDETAQYYVFYSVTPAHFYSPGVTNLTTTPAFYPGERVDAFSYEITDSLEDKNGGQGWTNAWAQSTPGKFTVVENTFSNFSGNLPNHGHKTQVYPGAAEKFYAWRGFDAFTNGTIYASYIMNYKREGTGRFAGLSFLNGTNELAFFGKASGSANKLSLDVQGSFAEGDYTLNGQYQQDYIIFGKFDIDHAVFSAKAYFINNDTVPTREPATWDVTLPVTTGLITRVDGIQMGAGYLDEYAFFDEIRVASSWNELLNYLIAFQGFEDTGDSWTYTNYPGQGDVQIVGDRRNSGESSLRLSGTNSRVDFDVINLIGYTNVVLSVDYSANGPDIDDDLEFWITTNGVSWQRIGYVDGYNNAGFLFGGTPHDDGAGSITVNPFVYNVSPDVRSFQLRAVFTNGTSTEYWYIDDVRLTGQAGPEMDVLGTNGAMIAAGDIEPATDDGTDFGSLVASDGTRDHTFTVTNVGLETLVLSGTPDAVALSGDTSQFSILVQPALTNVAVNAGTTFQIRFAPTVVGLSTAVVTMIPNDINENPYTFRIQGTGTLAAEPITQASNVTFSAVSNISMTVSWANGGGARRLVVAREGDIAGTPPTDGVNYAANPEFGAGDEVAENECVVYDGVGSTVDVTGLTPGVIYRFTVYEYNGTLAAVNYYTGGTPAHGAQAAATYDPVITEGDSVPVTMSENGAPIAFALTLNATDPDEPYGDILTWSLASTPFYGIALVSGSGLSPVVNFVPPAYYSGSDAFTVQVTDSFGRSDTVMVQVTVAAENQPGKAVFIFE